MTIFLRDVIQLYHGVLL